MSQLNSGVSILIVDDDAAMRQMLENVSRRAGYKVVGASGREEIFDVLQRIEFDAIITDMHMPALNGTEVMKAAEIFQPGAAILVMSGGGPHLTPELCSRIKAATNGVAPLMKPFTASQFLGSIQRGLDARGTWA